MTGIQKSNFGYIYKTVDKKGKIYIGKKQGQFNPNYYGSGFYLKRAINKYGKSGFKLEIIVYANNKFQLNQLEKYYIKKYRKLFGFDSLYNIANGGTGGNVYKNGFPSVLHREKLRLAWLGKRNPMKRMEIRKKISLKRLGKNNPMYGKHFKHTEETKEKCRQAVLGDKNPAKKLEVKEKLRKYMLGRKRGSYKKRALHG